MRWKNKNNGNVHINICREPGCFGKSMHHMCFLHSWSTKTVSSICSYIALSFCPKPYQFSFHSDTCMVPLFYTKSCCFFSSWLKSPNSVVCLPAKPVISQDALLYPFRNTWAHSWSLSTLPFGTPVLGDVQELARGPHTGPPPGGSQSQKSHRSQAAEWQRCPDLGHINWATESDIARLSHFHSNFQTIPNMFNTLSFIHSTWAATLFGKLKYF